LAKIDLIRQNGLIDIFDQDSALLDFASKVSLIANHGFAFAKIASQLKLPEDQFLTYLHRVEDAFLSKLNINPFFIIGKRLKGSMI
jgi:nucleotidyltransferase/DNA polymerase involved in DNA repair